MRKYNVLMSVRRHEEKRMHSIVLTVDAVDYACARNAAMLVAYEKGYEDFVTDAVYRA